MNELIFQVEFLSEVVLPSTSNTEGNIDSLDFIPGSNFLGMVAKAYDDFDDSFKVFHSGSVRFGDATLLHKGEETFKMPLSFFHEKLDDSTLVNHHLITNFSKFTQLKQKRKGFITKDLEELSFKNNYAQKSAYSKEHRRSKDGSMYGYSSMPKGLFWQFVVKYDGLLTKDIERIKNNLVGKKRLGKSKSSQYGQIEISETRRAITEQTTEQATTTSEDEKSSTVLLYAKSRIALVDEEGNPTYNLKYLIEGLEEHSIVWEKSQIKTSTFTPYNTTMQTKSYERVVINAGSVMVLKNLATEQLRSLEKGVGIYLSEGFGELLINPSFLKEESFRFIDNDKEKNKKDDTPVKITDEMVKFLFMKEKEKRQKLSLAQKVHDFIKENRVTYPMAMNAQWGSIRSLCASSSDEYILHVVQKYISEGVAKDKWKGKKRIHLLEAIEKSNKPLAFIKLLSMEMPKQKERKDD